VTDAVAVTGASGYIGSRLVDALAPYTVRPLVRRARPGTEQVALDLLSDWDGLLAAFHGVDAVVHLAGHNETVAASDPDRALAETVLASRRVASAATECGVRRLVYVSTVHVYGNQLAPGAHVDETVAPAPRSIYAIARLASEHLLAQAEAAGVEVVVLRLTNAVGAPAAADVDRWSLVANDLCRQAVRDRELVLRSSGLQWRDFIALDDVCNAVATCAGTGIAPGTYNLGTGEPCTVLRLAELVRDRFAARTGEHYPLRTAPPETHPPEPYTVSVERLASAGWKATGSLAAAVDELAGFCLDNKEALLDG
jgi:UDP-glucose 4-epimerase